jgi:hypothetical protein
MTVLDLIHMLLDEDVDTVQRAVAIIYYIDNRLLSTLFVDELIKRLGAGKHERRVRVERALISLNAIAIDRLTLRLLKSRSRSFRIRLAGIPGEIGSRVAPADRLHIVCDLNITANRTRDESVITACMKAVVTMRNQGLNEAQLADRVEYARLCFVRSARCHDSIASE